MTDEFERFAKSVHTGNDGRGNRTLGISGNLPTIARLRRCQNCLKFDQGERFDIHVKDCIRRDGRVMRDEGKTAKQIEQALQKLGMTLASGAYGYCLAREQRTDDNASADFTHMKHRCDRYEGRMVITAEEARNDPTVQEAIDSLPNAKK